MVKMKNIQQKDNTVTCICLPEGKETQQFDLILDISTGTIINPIKSENRSYAHFAKVQIMQLTDENKELPTETYNIWY